MVQLLSHHWLTWEACKTHSHVPQQSHLSGVEICIFMYFKYKLVVLSLSIRGNVSNMKDSSLNSLSPAPQPTSPSHLGLSPDVITSHALPGSSTVTDIVHVGVNITHMSLPHGAHTSSGGDWEGPNDAQIHAQLWNVRKVRHKQKRMSGECQGHSSWRAVLEEMGVDGMKTTQTCQNLDDSERILGVSQDPLHHFSLDTWGTEGSKTPLRSGHHHPVRQTRYYL